MQGENAMERWPTALANSIRGEHAAPRETSLRRTGQHLRHGGRVSMSSRTRWLLTLTFALLATPAWAQPQYGTTNLGPPAVELPFPLRWGDRTEGFFFATEAVAMRMNSALRNQVI